MTDGVVLLHGLARTSMSMRRLQRALEMAGFATLNLDYRSRHMPLDALADTIHPPISDFTAKLDGALHIVAHSMGGLLARIYLSRHRPGRLGRVVMLGTPHHGSEIADRLRHLAVYRGLFGPAGQQLATCQDPDFKVSLGCIDYPVGSIAGDRPLSALAAALFLPGANDGKVTVVSTMLSGANDHVTVHTSHTRLVHHPEAIDHAIGYLRNGMFRRDGVRDGPRSCGR